MSHFFFFFYFDGFPISYLLFIMINVIIERVLLLLGSPRPRDGGEVWGVLLCSALQLHLQPELPGHSGGHVGPVQVAAR